MSVVVSSAVWKHSAASGGTLACLLAIADIAHDDGRVEAYPRSQRRLAERCNTTPETVRRQIRWLVEHGELVVTDPGTGRKQASYAVRLPGLDEWESDDLRGGQNTPPSNAPPGSAKTPPPGSAKTPPPGSAKTPPPISTSLERPDDQPHNSGALFHVKHQADPSPSNAEFEAWWQAYPRRVGKKAARTEYERARTSVSASVLLEGAERYATECAERDPQFVKHPRTWLSQGCWEDEPAPVSRSTRHPRKFSDQQEGKVTRL